MHKITKGGTLFHVDNFPWDEGGAKPMTYLTVSYDEGGYYVHQVSFESPIRAVQTEHNTPVHEDSCMELFASFDVNDARYINFEINPNGAAHCAVGEGRHNRVKIDPKDIDTLGIKTEVFNDRWEIRYYIPAAFITKYLPGYAHKEGTVIKANFYKCGDKTGHEHYGCFNMINWDHPDFHRPEFFAELELA